MGKLYLLDCTLRDGGYINNWEFGLDAIKGAIRKLEATGIEMIEVGFMRPVNYNENQSLFPTIESFKNVIEQKKSDILYVGMIDMGNAIPLEDITPYDGTSVDGLRVIFKKTKMHEAYGYCQALKEKGYKVFVNFVNTDQYSVEEWQAGIKFFAPINPDGVTIVDTFGTIKRKQFISLVKAADKVLKKGVMLCYHAHNNLQQAFSNAEAMVELKMKRDVCIDACVFGMGRGAGNLNLELFAEFLNDNYGKKYRIPPMLEIMDEYLTPFYKERFWGYSLPLYLSARWDAHPNYAIYFAEKNQLPVKAFDEIFESMSSQDKAIYKEDIAEKYYQEYMDKYVDDKKAISELSKKLFGKKVLVVCPGKSLTTSFEEIQKEALKNDTIVVLVNFYDKRFNPDFIFCSNMRRVSKIPSNMKSRIIATSNLSKQLEAKYIVNFASYVSPQKEIYSNGGLMSLKVITAVGVKEVFVAGMDGYSENYLHDYFDNNLKPEYFTKADVKTKLISQELAQLKKYLTINFITPTKY